MNIFLPDGRSQTLEPGATGIELARKLKNDVAGPALALKVNGQLKDLASPLQDGDQVQVLGFDDAEGKQVFWHSSAHLLAQAVMRLFPAAEPTIGPAIEQGFYYDFANLSLHEADLERIEEAANQIVKERPEPQRLEYPTKAEALQVFGDNKFKKELIESFDEGTSAYRQGEFIDLCRGPHLPHLGLVQGFKVMRTSGAYWRGDAKNEQLTRIYGLSFPDKKMLKAHLTLLEEAQKRDHRLLGKQLGLFSFHQEGPGMPFFHPKGMVMWDELMRYWDECHRRENYLKIKTPMMMGQELWETSGHWGYYRENMYVSEIENKAFVIKPMNCPGSLLF